MIKSMIPSPLPLLGNPYTLPQSIYLPTINLFLVLITILCIVVPNPVLGSARVALIGDSLSVGIKQNNPGVYCVYCKVGVGIDTLIKGTISNYSKIPTDGSIVITVGTNDYYRGYGKEEYLDKLYSLITIVRTYNKEGLIILVVPNPGRLDVQLGVQSFIDSCNEVQEIMPNVKVIVPAKANAPDGIHYRSYRGYYRGIQDKLVKSQGRS